MDCAHTRLTLVPPEIQTRLRCRACHLTLTEGELVAGACPECAERDGARRRDFEEIEVTTAEVTRMRCEDCGLVTEVPPPGERPPAE